MGSRERGSLIADPGETLNKMIGSQQNQIYEFGAYRLDAAERLLLCDGEVVPLQPKVFDLLLAMVGVPAVNSREKENI